VRALRNVEIRSDVMSRSPDSSDPASGFGDVSEKGGDVEGMVLAQVRSRFGSVTSRKTEAL